MSARVIIVIAALAGGVTFAAAAAEPPAAAPPAAARPASPAREDTVEAGLTAALRAMPPDQRTRLRARLRTSPAATDERPVSGALRPNTFATLRAKLTRPRDIAKPDPAITARYVRKLDTLCATLPADARRATGMADDACAKVHARAAAPPGPG